MAIKQGGHGAAYGYPQFSNPLNNPIISDEIIEKFYCTSVVPAISNTKYEGEFKKGGDTVIFVTPGRVSVRPYTKDQVLKYDTFEFGTRSICIDKMHYFGLKIDDVDKFNSPMWPKYEAMFKDAAARRFSEMIECDVLGNLPAEAHCKNRGVNAGCSSGSYNLGDTGQPVSITSANVVETLTEMQAVLDEQCIPAEGRWVVIPTALKPVILNSPLGSTYLTGDSVTPLYNGELPGMIAGFKLYVSNFLPRVFDPGVNAWAYNIPFGYQDSLLFATQMEQNETMRDAMSFDTFYRGLQVWGWDILYPETIGNLYARLA